MSIQFEMNVINSSQFQDVAFAQQIQTKPTSKLGITFDTEKGKERKKEKKWNSLSERFYNLSWPSMLQHKAMQPSDNFSLFTGSAGQGRVV